MYYFLNYGVDSIYFIKNIKSYLKLLRPEISIMDLTLPLSSLFLSYYFLVYNYVNIKSCLYLLIPVIGGFFAITSSYIFNDCIDIEVDAINLPNRPLPSGTISIKYAIIYGSILFFLSFLISVFFNVQTTTILIISFISIMFYSCYIKKISPFSFLLVGFSYGLVPIGCWLSINPFNIYYLENFIDIFSVNRICFIFGIMICITDFGFSLAGVCRDLLGDHKKNIATFPVTYGIPLTSKIISCFWIIGLVLSLSICSLSKFDLFCNCLIFFSGLWMIINCLLFTKSPTPKNGSRLFIIGSIYRAIIFMVMIIDIISVMVSI